MRQHLLRKNPLTSFFVIAMLLGAGLVFLVAEGILPSSLSLASGAGQIGW